MNFPAAVKSCFFNYGTVDGRASRSALQAGCSILPFFGAIVVLIWLCQKGVEGENRFDPDPLRQR